MERQSEKPVETSRTTGKRRKPSACGAGAESRGQTAAGSVCASGVRGRAY
ncbi:hypothetical protein [Bacillus subtilis]|nr:hypothetical protein [Bacillus subtilis]WPP26073.1 hypothetical protein SIS06_02435 [Bacillus subtilis]